jgi:cell division GTPase FtsZ
MPRFRSDQRSHLHFEKTLIREMRYYRTIIIFGGASGNVGSHAIKTVAKIGKRMKKKILTFLVMPFDFEGSLRKNKAMEAMTSLKKAGAIIKLYENQTLLEACPSNRKLNETLNTVYDNFMEYLANQPAPIRQRFSHKNHDV